MAVFRIQHVRVWDIIIYASTEAEALQIADILPLTQWTLGHHGTHIDAAGVTVANPGRAEDGISHGEASEGT